MARFNGKQDLTKTQLLERSRHKSEAIKMRGLPTPKGTPPRVYKPIEKPWFISSPEPVINLSDMVRRLFPRPEKSTGLVLAKPKLYLPKGQR